ncbi:MAG: hypothetical protein NUV47_04225 [Patescibacteria group bacterium]|nr:hypothetical protein [Patescibacteria group bacterium]
MNETVDSQIKGEVGLEDVLSSKPPGSVVKVNTDGTVEISSKEGKKKKRDIEVEQEFDNILKTWSKNVEQVSEIWFHQCLRSSSFGVTQTLVGTEPLKTFFDEDGEEIENMERWLGQRAEGGYAYTCQLRINGKVVPKQPERKYYYKEDGEIFRELGGFWGNNEMDVRDNKKNKGSDTEAILSHVDRTNKMLLDMSDNKKETSDPSIVQSLTQALVSKNDNKGGNNDMLGLMSIMMQENAKTLQVTLQAIANKPTEQKNDNGLFLEMFRSVSEGMKEMGRGTNESINKISQMMMDMNRIMLEMQTKSIELRSNDKLETMKMMAEMQEKMLLVVKEMKEKGNDNSMAGGLDHVNKFLDQALKTQGLMSGFNAQLMGGMMNSFKDSVAVMKDLKDLRGDGEAEEKESETVLDKIISKAPEYMEAGAKLFGSMRNSNQFPINDNISGHNINEKEKVVSGENIQDVPKNSEITEKELLNDIIEDIAGYLDDNKSHEEIADSIIDLYGAYKDKLISILGKEKKELMPMISAGNIGSITKNYSTMGKVLELIRKGLN